MITSLILLFQIFEHTLDNFERLTWLATWILKNFRFARLVSVLGNPIRTDAEYLTLNGSLMDGFAKTGH